MIGFSSEVEPDVLLLDELFSNLEVKLKVRVRSELKEIQQSLGRTRSPGICLRRLGAAMSAKAGIAAARPVYLFASLVLMAPDDIDAVLLSRMPTT